MKNTKVALIPLTADDGEIISRATIEKSIDNPKSETYRIVLDGEKVGGLILTIDNEMHHNHLDILFVLPEAHSKGIGYGAWQRLRLCTRKRRFGKPARPILKSAISISM